MIKGLLKSFYWIANYHRIPKLPRGFLSSSYTLLNRTERRVLARLGARDPRGIEFALKRAKLKDVHQLIDVLEHQTPKRRMRTRIINGITRIMGSSHEHPHIREISSGGRRQVYDIESIMCATFSIGGLMRRKISKYPQMLPATAVTQDMREKMIAIADKSEKSIAEVQREAFVFFLQSFDTNHISNDMSNIRKEST